MNLVQFYEKISSDNDSSVRNTKYFSEEVTMYNVLNGTFPDADITKINVLLSNNPIFAVTLRNEEIASHAEDNLDKQIIQGAYYPLYQLNVSRDKNTLYFNLQEK